MRIQTVHIRNFRSLKNLDVAFDDVTTFIGPNGTGKSTVLRALDWFFNGGKAGELSDADCSFGAIDEPIEVRVTFSSLTSADRRALGKYAPPGSTTFTAWKIRSAGGGETFSANARSYPPFNEIRSKATAAEKKSEYAELRVSDPSLGLPSWTNQDACEEALTAWESTHVQELVEAPANLQTNFFGFNSNGKMSGLFDYVLVTADLRAIDEAQDTKSTIIGRILERSVDRTSADQEIAVIVEEARLKQQQVFDEKFKTSLDQITAKLNGVVSSYAPGRSIAVAPSSVELKAPRTTFSVTVLDGATTTDVDRQGHGFQRTLLISSLQLLAQSGAAMDDGVICLAIEEPELFQHPIQAQTFAKVLRSLAEDATKSIQITYATHSPYFLEARHFDQVRRLTRSETDPPRVTVHSGTVSDVKARLAELRKPACIDRQLDGIVTTKLAVALFANRVLLVEGTSDSAVLYGLGDRETIGALEAQGIAIVDVGGKSTIPLVHAILDSLGIPAYVVFDADSGFEARARANGKEELKIEEERRSHIVENQALLEYFGMPVVDFPIEQATSFVAIFNDRLEEHLAALWPEWLDAFEAIESAAGMPLRKNSGAYRTATMEAKGEPSALLANIMQLAKAAATLNHPNPAGNSPLHGDADAAAIGGCN